MTTDSDASSSGGFPNQPPPPPPPPYPDASPASAPSTAAAAPSSRIRTEDVRSDVSSFQHLMVPEPLVRALAAAGFERPSPVQKAAIPLGRTGADLIVQAKSGTGKTVVFAVILLERVKVDKPTTQALVLVPTREIAIQSEELIRKLAAELPAPAPTCGVFVGGLPIMDDQKRLRRLCHIAVGTPGRVSALLQGGTLPADALAMFVLDEADALLADSFYEDTTWIYDQLPKRKQVIALSATFTPEVLADLEPLMKRPHRVITCTDSVSLLGVRQFYAAVQGDGAEGEEQQAAQGQAAQGAGAAAAGTEAAHPTLLTSSPAVFKRKVAALRALLSGVSFHQAAVFCNNKPRAEWLAEQLNAWGFPCGYLSGDKAQQERMEAMRAVKGFKLRVVVSTDVMARGVDLERVNLVTNLDLPPDAATYWHRIGRTGRFGSRGVCVSYVTPGQELETLRSYAAHQGRQLAAALGGGAATEASAAAAAVAPGDGAEMANAGAVATAPVPAAGPLLPLPDVIPEDLYSYQLESDWERQALQDLQQRQQLPAASGGAGAGHPAPEGGASMEAAQGAPAGPLESGAEAAELPLLPEEVEVARKAAAKAAKECRRAGAGADAPGSASQQAPAEGAGQQAAAAAAGSSGYGVYAYGQGQDYGYGSGYGGSYGSSYQSYPYNDPYYASYYSQPGTTGQQPPQQPYDQWAAYWQSGHSSAPAPSSEQQQQHDPWAAYRGYYGAQGGDGHGYSYGPYGWAWQHAAQQQGVRADGAATPVPGAAPQQQDDMQQPQQGATAIAQQAQRQRGSPQARAPKRQQPQPDGSVEDDDDGLSFEQLRGQSLGSPAAAAGGAPPAHDGALAPDGNECVSADRDEDEDWEVADEELDGHAATLLAGMRITSAAAPQAAPQRREQQASAEAAPPQPSSGPATQAPVGGQPLPQQSAGTGSAPMDWWGWGGSPWSGGPWSSSGQGHPGHHHGHHHREYDNYGSAYDSRAAHNHGAHGSWMPPAGTGCHHHHHHGHGHHGHNHHSQGQGYSGWGASGQGHACECRRCLRTLLQDFLQRYSAWQAQYDVWYQQYTAWYYQYHYTPQA